MTKPLDTTDSPEAPESPVPEARPHLRFPDAYAWLVFVSAVDLMLTWGIVFELGGVEINPLAAHILHLAGFPGMIIFKFGVMIAVIVVCEFIAKHAEPTARRLAIVAVAISAFPILWSTLLLAQAA